MHLGGVINPVIPTPEGEDAFKAFFSFKRGIIMVNEHQNIMARNIAKLVHKQSKQSQAHILCKSLIDMLKRVK